MSVIEEGGTIYPSLYFPQLDQLEQSHVVQLERNYAYIEKHHKVKDVARTSFATFSSLGGMILFSVINKPFWCGVCTSIFFIAGVQNIIAINKDLLWDAARSEIALLKELEKLFKFRFNLIGKTNEEPLRVDSFSKDFLLLVNKLENSSIKPLFAKKKFSARLLAIRENLVIEWNNYHKNRKPKELDALNKKIESEGKQFLVDYLKHVDSQTLVPHVEYAIHPTPQTVRLELDSISKTRRIWETLSRLIVGYFLTRSALNVFPPRGAALYQGNLGIEGIIETIALIAMVGFMSYWIGGWREGQLRKARQALEVLQALPSDFTAVKTPEDAAKVLAQYKKHQKLFIWLEKTLQIGHPYSFSVKLDEIEDYKNKNNRGQLFTQIRSLLDRQSLYMTPLLHRLRTYAGLPSYSKV